MAERLPGNHLDVCFAEPWQALDEPALSERLHSGVGGLSHQAARQRLMNYGYNVLRSKARVPLWLRFLAQFKDFMILVLLAATGVSLLLGEIADAVTILAIVFLNAVLGFIQEYRAERSLEALKKLAAPEARVLRDNSEQRIPAEEIVPGDVVLLEPGDRVPGDLRLTEVNALAVDESPLTGESVPVMKQTGMLQAAGLHLADLSNMAFSGTTVTRGRGKGFVVATGMRTQMGQIADLMDTVQEEITPLQRRLAELGKALVVLCLAVCTLVVGIGLWQGEPVYRMIMTGVSLAVAAIPEGLPAIVTIALAIGVQKMIRRQAIIRKLPAVETLGCATTICSDKTGTLTQNEMTIRRVYLNGEAVSVGGTGYDLSGGFTSRQRTIRKQKKGGTDWPDLNNLLLAGLLCNNATLAKPGRRNGKRTTAITGDPTEAALLVLAAKAGIWRHDVENEFHRIWEQPFDSETKRMTVVTANQAGQRWVCVKGAFETVLPLCAAVRRDGVDVPLSVAEKARIVAAQERMGKGALRVLAVGWREVPANLTKLEPAALAEGPLVFLGLVGMMDPPRAGVKEAVARCHQAGIRTVMITGDHPVTALAVAGELGISSGTGEVITGIQIDGLNDRQLAQKAERAAVFARVSPVHKLRIVRALKARGQVVAMTGDGVNDAPALKEADIGVAMGRTGTDVTKEAAAMVLADDNFITIVAAVEEGRAIYANIRKCIRYLLSCNAGEVLVMLLASILALPLPLLPLHLLWVNLVTDGLPAMALGVGRAEPDLMYRPPRPARESIFAGVLAKRILVWGTYCGIVTLLAFAWGIYLGDLPLARTLAFCTLVFFQLFYVFDCQGDRFSVYTMGLGYPYLPGAVLVSALMQVAVVYFPPLQQVFKTVPLEPSHWLVVLFLAGGWMAAQGLWYLVGRPVNRGQPTTSQ
ncbi:MAG: cation-translocating P-type ATPase [Heliobacteriaceae bacterium]|nr:cation-translocating P-type ATPase [Heliobacteriaceae bacterium]MDD4586970.1 cation-translocating P-type ATPase [Heliobacteriaceae bacterium]